MRVEDIKGWRGVIDSVEKANALAVGVIGEFPEDRTYIHGAWATTNEIYHKGPGISKSDLDLVEHAPIVYLNTKTGAIVKRTTDAMNFGTVVHSYVLEPELASQIIAVCPNVDRRTKAGKEEYAAFIEKAGGKIVISEDDDKKALSMAEAVREHPLAGKLFQNGLAEISFYSHHSLGGMITKCRPDYLASAMSGWRIVDLKTTSSGTKRDFSRSACDFRYDVQAAFYSDVVHAVTGRPVSEFIFVAVEKEAPYLVSVYSLSDETLQNGRAAYQANLKTLALCESKNEWPGYPETIETLMFRR